MRELRNVLNFYGRSAIQSSGRNIWRNLSAAFAVAAVLAACAPVRETGPYPVWWSPVLELTSLDQIDARLRGTFWANSKGYAVYMFGTDPLMEKAVNSCDCRKRFAAEGYEPGATTRYFASYLGALCDALEKLRTAKPAQRGFVRNFVFDDRAMDVLPSMVSNRGACDFMCRLNVANDMRISWASLQDSIFRNFVHRESGVPTLGEVWTIEVENEKAATIRVTTFEDVPIDGDKTTIRSVSVDNHFLEILAYGDFNDDGLEDMLMRLQGADSVFVLTRDAPNAIFYVLNTSDHLCPTYQCELNYEYPDVIDRDKP